MEISTYHLCVKNKHVNISDTTIVSLKFRKIRLLYDIGGTAFISSLNHPDAGHLNSEVIPFLIIQDIPVDLAIILKLHDNLLTLPNELLSYQSLDVMLHNFDIRINDTIANKLSNIRYNIISKYG